MRRGCGEGPDGGGPKISELGFGTLFCANLGASKTLRGGDAVTRAEKDFKKLNQAAGSWMNCISTVTYLLWRIIN